MESRTYCMRLTIKQIVYISISTTIFCILCDARNFAHLSKPQDPELLKKLKVLNHIDLPLPSSNVEPLEVSSSFSSPPSDSPAPIPLPESVPLPSYCVSPPFTPQPPSPSIPSPTSPAPSGPGPNTQSPPPPIGPTHSPIPNPPQNVPVSPYPPCTIPSPPKQAPSPPKSPPSPPIFLPPIVYPPPSGPTTPPHKKPFAVWCVAKPTVPDPIIQEAMDYACGSGADCKSIQPNGSCYQPDTLLSHASYAFNSYWQNTKVGGATCDFGGTAMLITVDPSFDGCPFSYNG